MRAAIGPGLESPCMNGEGRMPSHPHESIRLLDDEGELQKLRAIAGCRGNGSRRRRRARA